MPLVPKQMRAAVQMQICIEYSAKNEGFTLFVILYVWRWLVGLESEIWLARRYTNF